MTTLKQLAQKIRDTEPLDGLEQLLVACDAHDCDTAELRATVRELASALSLAEQNMTAAYGYLRDPKMGGHHVPRAIGRLEVGKSDARAVLAKHVAAGT